MKEETTTLAITPRMLTDLEPAKMWTLVGTYTSEAPALTVTDQQSLERANDKILLGKNIIKAIGIIYDPMKKRARQPWDDLCQEERALLARIEPEVRRLDREAAGFLYKLKQEREALEAQARRIQEHRRMLELQTLHDIQEKEARARKEAAEAAKMAEEAEKTMGSPAAQEFRDMAVAAAKKADEEMTADLERAAKAESALVAQAPAVPQKAEVYGQTLRDHWTYEITNAALVPRELCSPDPKKLTEAARIYRDKKEFPGVRFYNNPIMAKTGR